MTEGTVTAPVIAGLGVGVAFVLLLALLFHDSTTAASLLQRTSRIDISIEGLKNSGYFTDEKIDFSIRVKGYGSICGYPSIRIINMDTNTTARNITILDDSNCDPTSYDFDKTWTLAELLSDLHNKSNNNLSIDEVGHYKVVATHGQAESERTFVVVNGGSSDGKTFCTSPRFQLSNMTAQNVVKGDSIRQAGIGSTIVLKADVKSTCEINNYPILITFGAIEENNNKSINENNNITFHSQQNVTMSYGQQITAKSLWKPDKAGNYEVVVVLAACPNCSSDYGIAQRDNFTITQ